MTAVAEPQTTDVTLDDETRGTGEPVGTSAFLPDVVEELRKPLSPDRIRTRAGRGGSGNLSYVAGHDDKRRANELFGFGNWGHEIKELVEIAAVEIVKNNKPGVHVGYRCTVRIWVNTPMTASPFHTEGVGYGDGVEYGPAARITACELAIKEAETDALKRAFTDLGDQFGLILYAKEDEVKRIERDRNAAAVSVVKAPQELIVEIETLIAELDGLGTIPKALIREVMESEYGTSMTAELPKAAAESLRDRLKAKAS